MGEQVFSYEQERLAHISAGALLDAASHDPELAILLQNVSVTAEAVAHYPNDSEAQTSHDSATNMLASYLGSGSYQSRRL